MPREAITQSENRFTLFPIKYNDIYQLYKTASANFWRPEEIKYSQDIDDWKNKLNNNEKYFLENILGFFAGSDGIVNENLVENFYSEFEVPEIRLLYGIQICIENIHSETYSLFIETLVKEEHKKELLYNAINKIPAVKLKADWALKYTDSKLPLNERLIAFIIVEGIMFCSSFCAIYWLKKRNLMPGLTQANHFIARDETLHCRTGIMLYSKLNNKCTNEKIYSIFKEAVDIEKEFVTNSLPVSLLGMNSKLMCDYIEFVADYWLLQLNLPQIYKKENPFSFMDYISLDVKTNFFENEVTNYRKADKEVFTLDLDEDF